MGKKQRTKIIPINSQESLPENQEILLLPKPPLHRSIKAKAANILHSSAQKLREPFQDERYKNFKKQLKNTLKKGAICSVVILALTAVLIVIDLHSDQRVYPRVFVGPIELGYNTPEEAKTKIQTTLQPYLETPITFQLDKNQVKITPAELGINFSSDQLLRIVPRLKFQEAGLINLAISLLHDQKLPLLFNIDHDHILAFIQNKFKLGSLRAKNATIALDDHKKIAIQAEVPGQMIDETALMTELGSNLNNLNGQPINLTLISESPRITAQALNQQKDQLALLIKQPLTLLYDGRKWKIDPLLHLDAIAFAETNSAQLQGTNWALPLIMNNNIATDQDGGTLTITTTQRLTLDQSKIQDFLDKNILAQIDRPTSDVKISKDEKGKVIIEGKGQNGLSVAKPKLIASLNLALNQNTKIVQIPVHEDKANVTVSDDLKSLGIKNLIATGHTAFAGSHSGRIHNINTGIATYNGLLVKPGETFSFNDHLGPVDGNHGYTKELVIKAEGTVPDYGGGLCQVSSTLYQAALYAGFPIIERTSHSYAVSYYAQIGGYGLDGTIYPGVHDIRFLNNSPAAILIQSYTEGDHAYFKFYGTDDGRKVWLEGPYQGNYHSPGPTQIVETDTLAPGEKKQVEINHTGFDVTWYRYIAKDGKTSKETLFTSYDAVPAKILVGKGTPPAQEASVPKT